MNKLASPAAFKRLRTNRDSESAVDTADRAYRGQQLASQSDSRLFVNSVEKAMRVLHTVGAADRPLTIAEIAAVTRLGRSASQRFLYTLERLGYLLRDRQTLRYRLSPRVLGFSSSYLWHDDAVLRFPDHFAEINHKTGESVTLSELDGTEIVVVARLPGRHMFSVNIFTGMRFPAFCNSAGRAILAFLPDDEARAIIDRTERTAFTAHTITDKAAIAAELAKARTRGYAIAEQESVADTISLAVPVLGPGGRPLAAVNLYVPLSRWPRQRLETELAQPMIKAARAMAAEVLGTK